MMADRNATGAAETMTSQQTSCVCTHLILSWPEAIHRSIYVHTIDDSAVHHSPHPHLCVLSLNQLLGRRFHPQYFLTRTGVA
jgi:hypothetical protein